MGKGEKDRRKSPRTWHHRAHPRPRRGQGDAAKRSSHAHLYASRNSKGMGSMAQDETWTGWVNPIRIGYGRTPWTNLFFRKRGPRSRYFFWPRKRRDGRSARWRAPNRARKRAGLHLRSRNPRILAEHHVLGFPARPAVAPYPSRHSARPQRPRHRFPCPFLSGPALTPGRGRAGRFADDERGGDLFVDGFPALGAG